MLFDEGFNLLNILLNGRTELPAPDVVVVVVKLARVDLNHLTHLCPEAEVDNAIGLTEAPVCILDAVEVSASSTLDHLFECVEKICSKF